MDCVVVGPCEEPVQRLGERHRPFRARNGSYDEIIRNSLPLQGSLMSYMDALSGAQEFASGTNPQLTAFELPNLGPACLASFLIEHGYDATVVNHYQRDRTRLDTVLDNQPLSVVVTTTYYTEHYAHVEVANYVRERSPGTKIISGGPYIWSLAQSLNAAELSYQLKAAGADIYIIESQGEATLARVIQSLRDPRFPIDFVPNLAFFREGALVRTTAEPESNSLDVGIQWGRIGVRPAPSMYMRTARGCPYRCAFCNYPAMAGDHQMASVETVLAGLRAYAEQGVRRVLFTDDTLNVPLPRFKSILRRMVHEGLNLQWVSFLRCSNVDDETIELMADAGCLAVYLGIESADPRILRAMNKFADVKRYGEAIRALHSNGIATFASFIAGFPGETSQSVARLADFIDEHPTTFFNVQLYYDDPLAPIQARREEFGMRGSRYAWSHATMDWQAASAHATSLLLRPAPSIPLPLNGFSLWSIPYLMDKGFTLDDIKNFARCALTARRAADQGDALDERSFMRLCVGDLSQPAGSAR